MSYRTRSPLPLAPLVLVAALTVTFWIAAGPAFGARAIQGAVGQVSIADGAALPLVGFRIYSALPGGETSVNDNTASCRNNRCMRPYITNSQLDPGGYISQQDATQVYNGDLPDQPFYELVDGSINDTTGDHIAFFGVSGVTANNSGIGNPLGSHCPPPTATNCFDRIDMEDAGPVMTGTRASYGGPPHTIRPISGLNPIPIVSVVGMASAVICPAGMACLSWPDPHTYIENMRPSNTAPAPPSPVKGVRLYKNFSANCSDPSGDDPGWTPIGSFDLGQTMTQDPLPPQGGGCNFYATTVRLVGPGGDPSEMETFRVGAGSQGVGSTPTAVRIVRFDAVYAGHGVMNVTWRSGSEGDIQGYFLTRGLSSAGPFERVSDLVRAEGNNRDYSVLDRAPAAARTYFYRLEILGRDGAITTSSIASAAIPARSRTRRPSVR